MSGASVVDSLDIEEQIDSLQLHAVGQGAQLITFAHPLQAQAIQGFKAGVESRAKEGAETAGPRARYDFLPSASAPPRVQMGTIIGQVAPSTFGELAIAGSYGPTWLCSTPYMPSGYVVTIASHGKGSPLNPVGMREHTKAEHQGLRGIPGNFSGYPLQDAFWTHGLGVGVRHRQGAVVTQVKTAGSYDIPMIPR
ncbi:hypothetical protein [Mycolicibacterium obuense]|uniref:hypothetical protein n=1 Tax=Mycolicibacterium obuense TaxID=1807 RepID=UPI00103AEDAD|nr:hypothetical protein [Mycolicibacterium obuense]